jgi:hypothetical protein
LEWERFRNLLGRWRERGDAEGEGFQILLLLDGDDHLFKIVGSDMSFTSTASAVR